MTTATDVHVFTPSEADIAVCNICGEGVNTEAHAEGAIPAAPTNINGARGRGRPRKSIETEERAQMALEERPVDDMALEGALNDWMGAKGGIEASRASFKDADELLSGMVGKREMIAGTYRVGKYVLTISDVAAHQRLKVKLAKD